MDILFIQAHSHCSDWKRAVIQIYHFSRGPSGVCTRPNLIHSIYTSPLESIIDTHTIHKMFYADDTQLYIAFKRNYVVDVTTEISNRVRSVKEWSQMNGLKLNNIKTEFLHGSSRHRLTNPISTLNLDGTLVHSAKICRNLGGHLWW